MAKAKQATANPSTFIYKIHSHQEIQVCRLHPHPDAIIPIDAEDQSSIEQSISENGQHIFAPLIVSSELYNHPKSGKCFMIYDGVNRWRMADKLGMTTVPCILAETNDPKRLILEVLSAGRKRSTGTRVLAYIMSRKDEILKAREINKKISEGGKLPKTPDILGASREAPMTSASIAEHLHCTRDDVSRGIDLIEAIEKKQTVELIPKPASAKYLDNLAQIRDRVLCGGIPIRTCLAAAGGVKQKGEARGDTEWGRSGREALISLANTFKHWSKVDEKKRAEISHLWRKLVAALPEELQ